jgi:tetratricopeptide (TPR) repeat protein
MGVVQAAAMALYGDLAHKPALPALLPPALGMALARPLGSRRAPALLRAAYAQALLHRGARAAAAAIVADLPDGAAAADLRGQLAEVSGDPARALPYYVAARDFERAQQLIDVDDANGGVSGDMALEQQLVLALSSDADAGGRARALWRLGQLTEEETRASASRAASMALSRRALGWYERALALAPNDETYLLAAGQQALTVGDKAAATRYYERALDAVPNSAAARNGLDRARS